MQFSMQSVLVMVIVTIAVTTVSGSCPADHGCFSDPAVCGGTSGTDCDIAMGWKANAANGIDFILKAKRTTAAESWVAIGFSDDELMGGDDIVICTSIRAQRYQSVGQTIELITVEGDSGISNVMTSAADGYLNCNFTRAVTVGTFDLSATKGPDMEPKYYYFFGAGPLSSGLSSGAPIQHEKDPYVSTMTIDYSTAGTIMANGSDSHHSSSESMEEGGGGAINITASIMLVLMIACIGIFAN